MKNNNSFSFEDEDPLSMYIKPTNDDIPKLTALIEDNPIINLKEKSLNNSKYDGIHNNDISPFIIKDKFSKISSSIQALNLSSKTLNSIKQITCTLEILDKQLYPFVDNLFDIIVELIYRLKGELFQKEELVSKINEISKNTDDYERKIMKLKKEITSKEREVASIINKSNIEKEKLKNNKKTTNNEITELKSENKKLINMISLYKNEVRKKEVDYQKIQEKYKSILMKANNTILFKNSFDIVSTLKEGSPQQDILRETSNKFNKYTFTIITNENENLISLVKTINKYSLTLYKTISDESESETEYIDINNDMINNNNLIDENTAKELQERMVNNFEYINKKISNICNSNKKLKTIKRTESAFGFRINQMSFMNDMDIENSNKSVLPRNNSKWFEHSYNKKISYKFDKNNVIKCDNSMDEL